MITHINSYNEALFNEHDRIMHTHFWFTGRLKLIIDALHGISPAPATMLEIGCGSGHVLAGIQNHFPHMELHGTEPSITAITTAEQRLPHSSFTQMDAKRIPFIEEFDLVGAFDVLEHIDDDLLVLRQMHCACKIGGRLILTVPQHPWLWSQTDEDSMHQRRYTRQELVGKVTAAGFDVTYVSSFLTLLLPAMLLSRRLQRTKPPGSSPLDDGFKIGPVLNRICSLIFHIECTLIAIGITLPIGGSLLLLAQKNSPANNPKFKPDQV